MLPKNKKRPMNKMVKKILHQKYYVLKQLALTCQGFKTKNIQQILTSKSLLRLMEIYEMQKTYFEDDVRDYFE